MRSSASTPTSWGPPSAPPPAFLTFGVGALIPLIPFLFLSGWEGIIGSAALTAVSLFVVGAALSLFTGRDPLYSGARMLVIGALAAIVTYALGSLVGANTNVSGTSAPRSPQLK